MHNNCGHKRLLFGNTLQRNPREVGTKERSAAFAIAEAIIRAYSSHCTIFGSITLNQLQVLMLPVMREGTLPYLVACDIDATSHYL